MGIIPVAALGVAASYAEDAVAAPLPVAVAIVLAVVTVIGLRVLSSAYGLGPCDGPASWLRRRLFEQSPWQVVAVARLPRLPQRVPHTRTSRPVAAPAVAASGLLRGPPGSDRPSRQRDIRGGMLPR